MLYLWIQPRTVRDARYRHPFPHVGGASASKLLAMKCLSHALLASVVLSVSAVLRAEVSPQAWLESYYLDPQPAEVPRAIQRLSQAGYFDRAENVPVSIGFLATVFAQHPATVDTSLAGLAALPPKHQRIVVAAVWQSGHPSGNELLRTVGRSSPVRAEIEQLASLPNQNLAETPVRSPSSMRLQWGAFLASGAERHVVSILEAFGLNEPSLNSAARMSLAQHAAAHPRVLQICQAQLERQPDEIRGELRAALQHAGAAAPRS